MVGYNVKIQEFHNGEVKFSIYPKGINYVPDEFKSYLENERIEQRLQESQDSYIYNPFTEKIEKLKEFESTEIEAQRRSHSQRVSVTRSKNKIHDLARSETWEYFVTLTYDSSKTDRYDYNECLKKCRVWLNNQRRSYAQDLAYIFVPEKHKDGAYHFHGLVANVGNMKFIDSGKVAIGKNAVTRTDKNKSYPTIYNLGGWHFGWSTATKVKDSFKATNYITKYVTKDICADLKGKHRYIASKNLHEPIELELLLSPYDCDRYAQLTFNNDEWLKYMVQDIALNHGYDFKYELLLMALKRLSIRYIKSTMKERKKKMEKVNKNVDSESKLVGMPVAIYTHFDTMEQKLLFEAVVLPDLRDVLNKYAPALGCLGVSEDIERLESEEKKND